MVCWWHININYMNNPIFYVVKQVKTCDFWMLQNCGWNQPRYPLNIFSLSSLTKNKKKRKLTKQNSDLTVQYQPNQQSNTMKLSVFHHQHHPMILNCPLTLTSNFSLLCFSMYFFLSILSWGNSLTPQEHTKDLTTKVHIGGYHATAHILPQIKLLLNQLRCL